MPRPGRFTPGKDPVPIVQVAIWTDAYSLAPIEIRPSGPYMYGKAFNYRITTWRPLPKLTYTQEQSLQFLNH